MDDRFMMVLEFAILLGYDGQLEQNSDMEKELFALQILWIKFIILNKMISFETFSSLAFLSQKFVTIIDN